MIFDHAIAQYLLTDQSDYLQIILLLMIGFMKI